MILLDTNVVVAFLNGDKSVLKRIRGEIDKIALSSVHPETPSPLAGEEKNGLSGWRLV
jgi:predicted nucleic acid-binding protein